MQIQLNSPKRRSPRPLPKLTQAEGPSESVVFGLSKDDLKAGGYGLAGGLALGAGGGYLGLNLGMEFGMQALDAFGSNPLAKSLGLIVTLPISIAYGAAGMAAGVALGGAVGVGAGMGVHHLTNRD